MTIRIESSLYEGARPEEAPLNQRLTAEYMFGDPRWAGCWEEHVAQVQGALAQRLAQPSPNHSEIGALVYELYQRVGQLECTEGFQMVYTYELSRCVREVKDLLHYLDVSAHNMSDTGRQEWFERMGSATVQLDAAIQNAREEAKDLR